MWQVVAEVPPYYDIEINNSETLNTFIRFVIGGMRPDINIGIPSKYRTLMQQCWDANPESRPDILTIWQQIRELRIELVEAMDNAIRKGYNFSDEEFYNISKLTIILSEAEKCRSRKSTSRLLAPYKNSSLPLNVLPGQYDLI
ncbi:10525_t:CDS:1 [Gigaspora margarita]|uniref:10525_t:CDS:1 n=1 Tax=Gigaspora margarita TaxID=4874 RepID=A0ABN7W0X3_GIGMA|nr:10525_t:CDS:1 [Gigaspora margarita]